MRAMRWTRTTHTTTTSAGSEVPPLPHSGTGCVTRTASVLMCWPTPERMGEGGQGWCVGGNGGREGGGGRV